ncbi:amidase [Stenoxybacter acetivorans]|uniref:amidase n=1 Tax=Stenoxybacter acetivorans TaxID=422441 RepID=UPI00068C4967|nr:amidase family protein [Stenoxybacter acetivorans]
MKKITLAMVAIMTSCVGLTGCASKQKQPFKWSESTIDELHQAFSRGNINCREVVEGYIRRIDALDKKGPGFNSIITLNPDALNRAAELDRQKDKSIPLWCVPVIVKDNINTADMPTTLGMKALKNSRPPEDADIVKKLKKEGAIILGKANMDELAISMLGLSSSGGQTLNAYVLSNGPGGSSGGTATAVSASFAMVGLGTDTGGSIRIPSALAGLTGIRPTRALADLNGVAPLSITQDTVGPMCRQVKDCANILRFTELNSTAERQKNIMNALNSSGLKGARLAMVSGMFPSRTKENQEYWEVIDEAIDAIKQAGATVDVVELPEQDEILNKYMSLSRYEIKSGLDMYLQSWPSDQDKHLRSYDELLTSKGYTPEIEKWLVLYKEKSENRLNDPDWKKNTQGRQVFVRKQISKVMDGKVSYDALLYPTLTQLNVPLGNNTEGRKNVSLSSFSGLPAVSFMAGMAGGKEPQPVALEFLGRAFSEPLLINLVRGYEMVHPVRVAPDQAPELP